MSRQSRLSLKSPAVILGLLRLLDALVVGLAAVLAYAVRHDWEAPDQTYYLATAIGVLVAMQVFHSGRVYQFNLLDQPTRQLMKLVPLLVAVGAILIVLAFFAKDSEYFSRAWAGLWLLFAALGLFLVRVLLYYRLRRWRQRGELTRNTVVVGGGEHGRRLLAHIRQAGDIGLVLRGVFDDRAVRLGGTEVDGVPLLGTLRDLLDYARREPLDLIIIALPWSAERRLTDIMHMLRAVPVDVQLAPDMVGFNLFDRGVTHLGGVPMLSVHEKPLSGWNYILKAAEDRLLAAALLLVFTPLMLLVACAIRASGPGPVLFRQKRYGFNNEEFEVFKFRTMHHRPDALAQATVPQAQRGDARVTAVGALLRRTSLDELPQLFNVLRGNMSLVGPRPHAVAHNQEYSQIIDQYYARHRVKPGITGWAQVHGLRGETDTPEKMEKRVQYDLYYIDNWSLLLDLRILAMTAVVGFVNPNAY